jgi:hypothetical protein
MFQMDSKIVLAVPFPENGEPWPMDTGHSCRVSNVIDERGAWPSLTNRNASTRRAMSRRLSERELVTSPAHVPPFGCGRTSKADLATLRRLCLAISKSRSLRTMPFGN